MSTACITGATSGIGAAFTTLLAHQGFDLILVARDVERLEALATQLRESEHVLVEVLSADLATDAGTAAVCERLADDDRPVQILVNNAGFGLNQPFVGGDLAREEQLLNVLVRAVMRLSHAVLPGMVQRGSGMVLNVSSVAAWLPMGTYSAAKSWVTVFSESLMTELSGTGVTVTAVCPGYTHTEFQQRAHLKTGSLPEWAWLDAEDVAREALADAKRGRALSVPSHRYQAMSLATRYAPRALVRRATSMYPRPRPRTDPQQTR